MIILLTATSIRWHHHYNNHYHYHYQVWLAAWRAWTDWSADLPSTTAWPAPPCSSPSPSSWSSSAASTSTRLHYTKFSKQITQMHSIHFNPIIDFKNSLNSWKQKDVFTSANVIYKLRPARNCVPRLWRKRLPSQYCLPLFKMPGRTPVPLGLFHNVGLGLQRETKKW